jgi:hypothetical protein
MVDEFKCNRCGRCCHFILNGQIKKCRFCIKIGDITVCRKYKNRLKEVIYSDKDKKTFCGERINTKYDYKDCPYNTNKEILDVGY